MPVPVEYGNENQNGFDVRASGNGKSLIGEAFNVAPSFFQLKKTLMLKKLRVADVDADYKLLLFNHDAVAAAYKPTPKKNEFFLFVRVGDDGSFMVPRA
jgi:hypothetical protein